MTDETTIIIDWQTSIKLAAGQETLAKELLVHFVASLPESLEQLDIAHKKNDKQALANAVHRLHGACCYCGVPRLKRAVYNMEDSLLREPEPDVSTLFNAVKEEIQNVILTFEKTQ